MPGDALFHGLERGFLHHAVFQQVEDQEGFLGDFAQNAVDTFPVPRRRPGLGGRLAAGKASDDVTPHLVRYPKRLAGCGYEARQDSAAWRVYDGLMRNSTMIFCFNWAGENGLIT